MGLSVLLIPGDQAQDSLRNTMRLSGELAMDVSVARTPVEVRSKPVPDVILLDLSLAQPSSFEILQWLRSENPYLEIPVIALSSANIADSVERAYQLGANACVLKRNDGGLDDEVVRGIGSYAKALKSG
jgi:CheY-like chemotaxis protein